MSRALGIFLFFGLLGCASQSATAPTPYTADVDYRYSRAHGLQFTVTNASFGGSPELMQAYEGGYRSGFKQGLSGTRRLISFQENEVGRVSEAGYLRGLQDGLSEAKKTN